MGLDSVELLMDVEDSFGIEISDEEATKCLTVGDLYECIKKKMDFVKKPDTCLTMVMFNSIRKILVDNFGISRKSVVPKAKTDSLLPIECRRKIWKQLAEKMHFDLPELELSSALVLFYCILCTILMAIAFLKPGFNFTLFIGVIVAWIFFSCKVVNWVSRPLAVVVPSECKTIGDLSKVVITKNFKTIEESCCKKDIWDAYISLVSYNTGEEANMLKPETRFVEDLKF